MNSQLNIIQYTEKSFVVRGNTTENKEQLKNIGGKYNALLKGGPGWIFPNFLKKNVEEYVKSGSITNSSFSSKEENKEYKKDYINKNNTHDTHESSLTKRVETLEEQIKLLMNKLGLEKEKDKNNSNSIKKKKDEPEEEEDGDEPDEDEPEEEVEITRKSFLTKNKK